jgi:hypothetical protein
MSSNHCRDKGSNGENELLFAAASMAHDHYLLLKRGGGPLVKNKANEDQDRVGAHAGLMRDYFHPTNPISDAETFHRRYQMFRKLFMDILHGVRTYDDYFDAKLDATGKIGFFSRTKNVWTLSASLCTEYLVILLMSNCA